MKRNKNDEYCTKVLFTKTHSRICILKDTKQANTLAIKAGGWLNCTVFLKYF
jgi:hypothetical protein